ncbi:glycosyltransferase involved in cell wall biosynthesis [Thermocatellispora tengchongensis]|uniref:Glycosyltransferase involved in cell wall biosynthesis n=1 Tax=Thermocatellispora tengchongensis TaxID=1073253 RepID=A0A840NYN4_9ACTN|nr:glycosyltransferase [Thermocatellispora tengchongensis]MBB5131879.1 glycosyltransferase involved in cell wall biosynthesis [Thermocatellispora tengchongensis]
MNIAIVASDAATDTIDHSDAAAQRAHLYAVARELGREHRVTIYARLDSPERKPKTRIAHGLTVEHVPAGPAESLPEDEALKYAPEFGARLHRRWESDRPDIVHAFSWTGGLAAIAAADGLDVPVTQTLPRLGPSIWQHGAPVGEDAKRVRLARALGRTATAVIARCGDEESELIRLGVPRHHICVVPCGIDIERYRRHGPAAARGKRPRLLHIGPLGREHGAHTAVRALEGVADAELVIAGGPPAERLGTDMEAHRLRILAKEVGVDDRVTILGQVSPATAAKLIRSADAVLSLPEEAAAGVVALEAMACGVPVIASAVGAHLDAVLDGVTGVLVPPGHPARTARLARELLADPTRRAALGYAGADRVRSRYSFERISHELLRVYEEALETSRSSRHLTAAH